MNRNSTSTSNYRAHYLQRICDQNLEFFDSPYVWTFKPEDLPLNPRRRFSNCKRLFLEIGFGHGEALEYLVQRRPKTGFVGIERRCARVRKTLKRLNRVNANQILLIRLNLELFHNSLFAPGSFDEILVNHPDPWPKKRHEHHRFFRPETTNWLATLLAPDGSVEVASDDAEYFFQVLRLFEENPKFESLLPPPLYTSKAIPSRPMSRYERKKRRAGKTVRLLRFAKT